MKSNYIPWITATISIIVAIFRPYYREKRLKRELEGKQKRFIEELNSRIQSMQKSLVDSDNQSEKIQNRVEEIVEQLSDRIFNSPEPKFKSFRLEETNYPKIKCKWCEKPHQAKNGSLGKCQKCNLPFDLWIGSQSDEVKG